MITMIRILTALLMAGSIYSAYSAYSATQNIAVVTNIVVAMLMAAMFWKSFDMKKDSSEEYCIELEKKIHSQQEEIRDLEWSLEEKLEKAVG